VLPWPHETAACQAAGAALSLVDACLEAAAQAKTCGGSAKDVPAGFGICRPPGHHAVRQSCMGFCLFSTVAIAARYAQQHHGLQKVTSLQSFEHLSIVNAVMVTPA